jgi:4-diphosphocytidyl-2-C-methyl-D-erythritol kinase
MLSVFAPAKINLYLHITGRRDDGYHTLDSLAVFADIGDGIVLNEAESFSFEIAGPFAGKFSAQDRGESNLVVRAAKAYAALTGRQLRCRLTLIKNLPLAAGLGGGSSDAAATLRTLARWWEFDESFSTDFLLALGADMPLCLAARPARVGGIGEEISPVAEMPPLPVVLVNPGAACPTPEVFRRCRVFSGAAGADWRAQRNDLQDAAIEIVPAIREALEALRTDAALARMSGSGATCFGLYETVEAAEKAAQRIGAARPGWWVRSGMLNP